MAKSSVLVRSKKKKALACIQKNRFQDARRLYQEICRADSRDAESWFMLGATNGQLELFDEAISCCRKATALCPDYTDAHYNLAQAYLHQGRYEEAISAYRKVVQLAPDHADAHNALGLALESISQYDEAIRSYQEAVRLRPDQVDAWNNLGNTLQGIGDPDKCIEYFRRALALQPDFVKARINLGFAFVNRGSFNEALAEFDYVQRLEPNNSDAVVGKAAVLEKQGDFEAAHELVRPFIDGGAAVVDERAALIFGRVARHVDRRADAIAVLEQVLAGGSPKGADDRSLCFQLGKLYDEVKDYDRAFPYFQRANELQRACYDPENFLRQMDALMGQCTADFFQRAPTSSLRSERPVFIVGMPRSGTTLTEQILASHPAVAGGGELKYISTVAEGLQAALKASNAYPGCLDAVTEEVLNAGAQRYLDFLADISPDAERVTDKMPHNFQHLGLIALLFPNARVIHCMRHPLDICLSIYTFSFNAIHSYATDLHRLGEHYLKYQEVMRHWKQVLPIPIMDVKYEEMVADQERLTRELIAFCGLDWDDRCLRFYDTRRVVNTFSYDQVRRPIYKKSVERWRNYEKFLGPLKEVLGIED